MLFGSGPEPGTFGTEEHSQNISLPAGFLSILLCESEVPDDIVLMMGPRWKIEDRVGWLLVDLHPTGGHVVHLVPVDGVLGSDEDGEDDLEEPLHFWPN